ncbi:MAG: hypothetical protein PHG27_05565 [Massilibacteroides sp.]|nr:hypothetical protein [Massilibacteroides sp.]MDD3063720.1 hypothetical protein [Massilibacteroides sp.]MDD4115053.1 hypothetical protein [Massilibacteroides sp.]MDD4659673.1 hypothetical protein [Massilibacteroides sp.]
MMDDKQIEQYLAAYYEGTATEQEEKILDDFFFQKTTLPKRWKEEQQIYLLLRESNKIELPENLQQRIELRLDAHIAKSKRWSISRTGYKIAGIAAAILLCIAVGIQLNPPADHPDLSADTYTDPHEAAAAAGQALTFLSTNLNKGVEQMDDAKKEIQQINEIIQNQLK